MVTITKRVIRHVTVLCLMTAVFLGVNYSGLAQENPDLKPKPKEKPVSLVQLIPANTLCYVVFNDIPANNEKMKETIISRAFTFITKKETLKAIKDIVTPGFPKNDDDELDIDKQCKKELGMSIKELPDLLSGEIACALIDLKMGNTPFAEPDINFILKIDVTNPDKLINVIGKFMKRDMGKYPIYKMSEPDVVIFKERPKEEAGLCFTIYKESFLLSLNKSVIEKAVRGLTGKDKLEDNLGVYPAYQKINNKIKGDNAAFVLYLNSEALFNNPMLNLIPFNIKGILEVLGLNSVKSVGMSTSVKDGRFYNYSYLYSPGEKKGLLEAMAIPRVNDPEGILLTSESDIGGLGSITMISMVAAIAIPNLLSSKLSANETSAIAGLKMLVSCEATWHQQNPAGTSVKTYWTYDISCFNRMHRADCVTKVNFIDIAFAKADAKPFAPANIFGAGVSIEDWSKTLHIPKSGYHFRMIAKDEDGTAYNQVGVGGNNIPAGNQYKFAICAFPAEYGTTGIRTFIVNEGGTIYSKDIPPQPKEKIQSNEKTVLSADETKKINDLIEQLGSDNWQKREEAQSALIKIGKRARGLLEKAKDSKDVEVRTRVNNILKDSAFSDDPDVTSGGIDRWPAADPTTQGWAVAE